MSVSIVIEWLDDVPERARKILNAAPTSLAPESWWDGQYLPGLGVADQGLQAIVQVWASGNRLFDRPGADGRQLSVPYFLWQMRRALQLAAEGAPTRLSCPPDSETLIQVRPLLDEIWMASWSVYDGEGVSAPAGDWEAGLTAAEDEVRQWVLQHLPELDDDEVLGPWLRGGGPPRFLPLVAKWEPEWDEPRL